MKEGNVLGLVHRKATPDDLKHFDEIAATVQFDIGLPNWQLYYSLSPNDFYVLIEPNDNKIVGISTGNRINGEFFWAQQIVVLPEYRRRKLLTELEKLWTDMKLVGMNRNYKTINAALKTSYFFTHKQIGFSGRLGPHQHWTVHCPIGVQLVSLNSDPNAVNPVLLNNLYKYDDELYANCPAPKRRQWLINWIFPDEISLSINAVAYKEDDMSICGYGVIRRQTNYCSITPLYANSDEIAYSLFCMLASQMKKTEIVYLEFHADRKCCFRFVKEAGMCLTYSNFRAYTSRIPDLSIEKLYCDNEFWPL